MVDNNSISQNSNKKNRNMLLASGFAFLVVLASIPDLASAHRGYGSCGRSYRYGYPRWHSYGHGHGYGGGGGCHWGNNWCGGYGFRRRHGWHYHPVVGFLDDLMHAGMNSLARPSRRSLDIVEREGNQPPRYFIEDHGREGLELTVDVLGFQAKEIDLEVTTTKDGANTIVIRGIPSTRFHRNRRRGSDAVSAEFSQSFVVNDDTIDVEGITASLLDEGILRISLPRKPKSRRNHRNKKRLIPSLFEDRSLEETNNSKRDNGEETLVYDAKRRIPNGSRTKGSTKKPLIVEENLGKAPDESISIKRNEKSSKDDDLFISEEEDIW